ncbi:MAG: H-X9-DG-CTERM domain-containing protein [Armatimonadia bacterium]
MLELCLPWHPQQCLLAGAGQYSQNIDPRHNDGVNVGFLDGHAKWLKAGKVGATNFKWVGDDNPLWMQYEGP